MYIFQDEFECSKKMFSKVQYLYSKVFQKNVVNKLIQIHAFPIDSYYPTAFYSSREFKSKSSYMDFNSKKKYFKIR